MLSGLGLALLLGYRRGLLSAAAGLVLLAVGIVVGYRVGPAGQAVIESWTGTSPLTSRFIASAAVFLVIYLVGRLLIRRLVALLGPLRWLDQVGGALVSAAAFALVAGFLVLAVSSSPYLPPQVGHVLDQSRTAALVTSEAPRFTPDISRFLGDRILESYLNLRRLSEEVPALLEDSDQADNAPGTPNTTVTSPDTTDTAPGTTSSPDGDPLGDVVTPVIDLLDRLVILEGDDRVDIPPVAGLLENRPDLATELLDMLNLLRIEEGEEPLAWSAALAEIAARHGVEMYKEGYFSHVSPLTGDVGDRLTAQGIPFRIGGENLALNPTVEGVHGGLAASPGHRATMLETRFTRVGISVHDGPLGLMVVQVFTG